MLSEQELDFVTDASWILMKQVIIQKVYQLFGDQVPVIAEIGKSCENGFPHGLMATMPKISKGENYKGLPYVMLDYPALFDREKIFALRTMFWWGNFFSVTLHLSGLYKEMYAETLIEKMCDLDGDVYLCIQENEWQHHFQADNYMPLSGLGREQAVEMSSHKRFIKIAIKYDISRWQEIDSLLEAAYHNMLQVFGS